MEFVFIQPIFFKKLGTAAVGTDAVLAVVQAEHSASALLQLVIVGLIRLSVLPLYTRKR